MIAIEQTSEELFDKIRSRFGDISIGDETAKSTLDPKKAKFFNFDFVHDGKNYGNITISLIGDKALKIFYDKEITADLNPQDKAIWYRWLKGMREFARSNMKEFDVRDIAKSGLNLQDLKHLNRDSDKITKDEIKVTTESRLYGTSKSSYQKLENVRIIARHSKPIVDEDKPGARSRNIAAFYIENSLGERFKCPEGTTFNGARAYARHVKNGGNLMDDFGQHITKIINEMNSLKIFVRNMRGRQFEDIETNSMVESAINYYGKMHRDLFGLRSQRGYEQYKSLWTPELVEDENIDLNLLKERFVKKIFDERLTDALPIVFKAYTRDKSAVEKEFEQWAESILAEEDTENPINQQNIKDARKHTDLEESDKEEKDEMDQSVLANKFTEKDLDGNVMDDEGEDSRLSSLFKDHGFQFRYSNGVYYFESKEEVSRAKDWISKEYPTIKMPKFGVFDYGYGVYGSTTFDRELPNGKGVMEDASFLNLMKKLSGIK